MCCGEQIAHAVSCYKTLDAFCHFTQHLKTNVTEADRDLGDCSIRGEAYRSTTRDSLCAWCRMVCSSLAKLNTHGVCVPSWFDDDTNGFGCFLCNHVSRRSVAFMESWHFGSVIRKHSKFFTSFIKIMRDFDHGIGLNYEVRR